MHAAIAPDYIETILIYSLLIKQGRSVVVPRQNTRRIFTFLAKVNFVNSLLRQPTTLAIIMTLTSHKHREVAGGEKLKFLSLISR